MEQENKPENKPRFQAASPEQIAARQKAEDERIYRELEAKADIPKRYARSQLAEFLLHKEWGAVFARLHGLVTGEVGNVVVLCGKRGTGKTVMAIEVMRQLMRARSYAYYEDLERYLRLVRRRDVDWIYVQELFEDPRLLVLDECAKMSDAPWDQRLFFDLVNARYKENKHTILICSVLPAELPDFLGPSITDRVNEGGAVLYCNWESFRK